MQIDIIETSSLGDRSYLVSDGGVAVVIDPQRDIDRVLTWPPTAACGSPTCWRPTFTTTTSPAAWNLPARPGADYVVPAGDECLRAARVSDGDVIDAGPMRLQVMHTPGHTHHHVSYVLRDTDGAVEACSPAARCSTAPPAGPTCSAPSTPRP